MTECRLNPFRYDPEVAGRAPVFWGFAVLVPCLLGILAWAAWAPLNAAAIARGEVVLNDARKTVQYLEGGIVEQVLVQEAQWVNVGQPVLVVRSVGQRTQIDTLHDQLANARALHARLVAERDQLKAPDMSEVGKGLDVGKSVLASLERTHRSHFQARLAAHKTKVALIRASQQQARKEIAGLNDELAATRRQWRLTEQELEAITNLYDKGIATLTQKRDLEKAAVELEGRIGAVSANIAQLEQRVLAADIEVLDLQHERQSAILEHLQANELGIQELQHQLSVTTDALERTVVKAPVRGRVMDLQVHTASAVIAPGQRLMDIVPEGDRMILEARVNPNDIDLVMPGMSAKVVLLAYKASKVPKLDGEVLSVSGDILADESTGERYFLARVLVDEQQLERLEADVSLYPGMPAQVFLLAGERTLADYLFSPISDAAYRAFREE